MQGNLTTARVDADTLASGQTLPYDWYSDPSIAELEREQIFRQSWHYVGHTAQLAGQGDFLTVEVVGAPVIVLRDGDRLNAFHNVCRHRGAEVIVAAEGNVRRLQCHYHAWTYGLDGQLRGAPRADREACFERSELGLRRASVDTWGPFVFVHLDADAPPLADTLGDIPELVREVGIDVDALNFYRRFDYDLACNWKIAMENYLECYHCPTAHPGFSDVLDTRPDNYDLIVSQTYAFQNGPLRPANPGSEPAAGYNGRDGAVPEGRYFAVWPTLKININPGLQNLALGPMTPTGTQTCHGRLDYFFGPDVSAEWIADMLVFDDQVGAEDRTLVESVQRGVRSGSHQHGRVMLASEKLIAAFQQYVLRTLTTDGGPR